MDISLLCILYIVIFTILLFNIIFNLMPLRFLPKRCLGIKQFLITRKSQKARQFIVWNNLPFRCPQQHHPLSSIYASYIHITDSFLLWHHLFSMNFVSHVQFTIVGETKQDLDMEHSIAIL